MILYQIESVVNRAKSRSEVISDINKCIKKSGKLRIKN